VLDLKRVYLFSIAQYKLSLSKLTSHDPLGPQLTGHKLPAGGAETPQLGPENPVLHLHLYSILVTTPLVFMVDLAHQPRSEVLKQLLGQPPVAPLLATSQADPLKPSRHLQTYKIKFFLLKNL
jgi:hypothetical protein